MYVRRGEGEGERRVGVCCRFPPGIVINFHVRAFFFPYEAIFYGVNTFSLYEDFFILREIDFFYMWGEVLYMRVYFTMRRGTFLSCMRIKQLVVMKNGLTIPE